MFFNYRIKDKFLIETDSNYNGLLGEFTNVQAVIHEGESVTEYFHSDLLKKYNILKTGFSFFLHNPILKEMALYANKQTERITLKYDQFLSIIKDKYKSNELTYFAVKNSTEDLYQEVLMSLVKIKEKLTVLSDTNYRESFIELQNNKSLTEDEKELLLNKKTFFKEEEALIKETLLKNEKIIFKIDKLLLEVNNLPSIYDTTKINLIFQKANS